jgi:hypothetical protein
MLLVGFLFWRDKVEKNDFLNKLVEESGGKWPFDDNKVDLPSGIVTPHGEAYIRITKQEFYERLDDICIASGYNRVRQ